MENFVSCRALTYLKKHDCYMIAVKIVFIFCAKRRKKYIFYSKSQSCLTENNQNKKITPIIFYFNWFHFQWILAIAYNVVAQKSKLLIVLYQNCTQNRRGLKIVSRVTADVTSILSKLTGRSKKPFQ